MYERAPCWSKSPGRAQHAAMNATRFDCDVCLLLLVSCNHTHKAPGTACQPFNCAKQACKAASGAPCATASRAASRHPQHLLQPCKYVLNRSMGLAFNI